MEGCIDYKFSLKYLVDSNITHIFVLNLFNNIKT
jgi:hypothetical protein